MINVGSEVSEAAAPLLGMYTASKHAVKGFTDSLRLEIEEMEKAPVAITLIQPTAVNTPFPQHARNYMATDAKLPEPMIDPRQVADAILEAAVTHTRDKKVGARAVMNTAMAKFARESPIGWPLDRPTSCTGRNQPTIRTGRCIARRKRCTWRAINTRRRQTVT